MARRAKPWFWNERKSWYVNINGARHNLGPEKKDAFEQFHKLMATPMARLKEESVAAVLDDFQTWTIENRAKRTADRYKDFLQAFISFTPDGSQAMGLLRVGELHSGHVTAWLATLKTWNSTTKRNAITALQRAFNWSVKNRGLDRNPIKGMEKPEAKRRNTVVTPDEFDKLLAEVKDQPFRELLIISYDCGARPFEIKRLEARHVQLDKQRAVIPTEEAKGNIPRAIYFPTARSIRIIKRLVKERPEGPLFLNNRGRPWTGMAVKCRMEDLEDKVGKRIRHYDLRRTFITDKIVAGVDSHVVAALAGHKSTAMVDRHYSCISDDYAFMLAQSKKTKSK